MSVPADQLNIGYRFSAIDLPSLPPPDLVETLDYQTLLQARLDDYVLRMQEIDASFSQPLPSDPAYQVLAVGAYRETLIRQRINDAARQTLLAFATGDNLDHLGALKGVARLVVEEADPDANPPTAAVYESDDDYRRRIALAPEGFSVAGPEGAYIFHGLTAGNPVTLDGVTSPEAGLVEIRYRFDPEATAAQIKDISAVSPDPGDIVITVLSREGDGEPDQSLIDEVTEQLSDQHIRPMDDNVSVQGAEILEYAIEARLWLYPGPGESETLAAAQSAAEAYAEDRHRLGRDVTRSTLFGALSVPGAVQRIELLHPASDIVADDQQAAYCTGITLTVEGRDE